MLLQYLYIVLINIYTYNNIYQHVKYIRYLKATVQKVTQLC